MNNSLNDEPSSLTLKAPRIWLKAFWGYRPDQEGYLGFTRPGDRERFIALAHPDDLVLIYGANTSETARDQRQQALGFLMVDLQPIDDTDKMSPLAIKEKKERGWSDRWTHAVPVRRAWRVNRRIDIRAIAPETYVPERARSIASQGELMLAGEASRALKLPVLPVNVFGELPIDIKGEEFQLISQYSPSRGLPQRLASAR